MKRILIALAVLLSVQFADAQVKTPEVAKNALDKAVAASKDEKKAAKMATWLKLATAYMDAYNAPAGTLYVGASKQEVQLLLATQKLRFSENVKLAGEKCTKDSYPDKDLYFSKDGRLVMINVTKPVDENALEGALVAYMKAYELDLKHKKEKDIVAGIENVARQMYNLGMNRYMLEDYAKASDLFEKAAAATAPAPVSKLDTTSLYNAGFTAWMAKDYPRAKGFFETCRNSGYYHEGGEVFAKLAEVYGHLGDKKASKEALEQGFTKYPQSQSILIGLINYYLTNNEDPKRLFDLISRAKKNEPNNASLYYVEGNIYNELRQADPAKADEYVKKAAQAYDKCSVINPNYEFGYIGKGIMYYNIALDLQQKAANELDDAKWVLLNRLFTTALKNAIDPFEKAYKKSKDTAIRVNIAEYLKNIYYRFSSESEDNMKLYKKYNEVVKTGKPL